MTNKVYLDDKYNVGLDFNLDAITGNPEDKIRGVKIHIVDNKGEHVGGGNLFTIDSNGYDKYPGIWIKVSCGFLKIEIIGVDLV